MLNQTQIETIKQEWHKGDRIAIKEMVDEDLPSGLEGTVTLVDDIGQIQVNWDNGSTLAIDPEIDSFVHLNQNMKLIMPLNISYLLGDPDETDDEYETTDTMDIKLLQEKIDSENQDLPENGLVEYMDEGSLKDKLIKLLPSCEERGGISYGTVEVEMKSCLTSEELEELKEYIRGQMSDGWGEGFEQREIKTGDGSFFVSFWSPEDEWKISTERELQLAESGVVKVYELKQPVKLNATFECKPSDIRPEKTVMEKVVELSANQWRDMMNHPLKDRLFFEEYRDDMGMNDDGERQSLLVLNKDGQDGLLVEAEGYNYARYSSYLPDARTIIQDQCPIEDVALRGALLRALVVEPGMEPYVAEFKNTLENFQAFVGGSIETVGLSNTSILICNEEGKLMNLPGNRRIGDDIIAGRFLIVGDNGGEDFISLSKEDITKFSSEFEQPEHFNQQEVEDAIDIRIVMGE